MVCAFLLFIDKAAALDACPTPELLTSQSVSVAELFSASYRPNTSKGEFETSEQFQRRIAERPHNTPDGLLVKIEVPSDSFSYNADSQQFSFRVGILEVGTGYHYDFSDPEFNDVLGGFSYPRPVQILGRRELVSSKTSVAENAFGARTLLTKNVVDTYVVFDSKGREQYGIHDNLFTVRDRFEWAELFVPVPLEAASAKKDELEMVAWVEPRFPWALRRNESVVGDMSSPISADITYNMVFADILCVGVRDADLKVLASWVTR